jgi:hypothetical protein
MGRLSILSESVIIGFMTKMKLMLLLIASKSVQWPVRADGMMQMECVVIGGLLRFPMRQPCCRPHLQQFRLGYGMNT